jgi:hypothetical protein
LGTRLLTFHVSILSPDTGGTSFISLILLLVSMPGRMEGEEVLEKEEGRGNEKVAFWKVKV